MAAFEAVGWSQSAERLRPGWYHRWMDDVCHHQPECPFADRSLAKQFGPTFWTATGTVSALAAWLASSNGFADEYDFDDEDEYDDEDLSPNHGRDIGVKINGWHRNQVVTVSFHDGAPHQFTGDNGLVLLTRTTESTSAAEIRSAQSHALSSDRPSINTSNWTASSTR